SNFGCVSPGYVGVEDGPRGALTSTHSALETALLPLLSPFWPRFVKATSSAAPTPNLSKWFVISLVGISVKKVLNARAPVELAASTRQSGCRWSTPEPAPAAAFSPALQSSSFRGRRPASGPGGSKSWPVPRVPRSNRDPLGSHVRGGERHPRTRP